MSESLEKLEQQRSSIFEEMFRLPDFRSGSITATRGTCGKPNCRCHQPHHLGHGPNFRLTRKQNGKTITETFATSAELCKAQREVEAYHRFRLLAQQLLEVNEKICRARPAEQELTPRKKNRRGHPAGNRPRSRTSLAAHFLRTRQNGSSGFGSDGDGHAFGHA
jgi:hypothetical protein